MKNIFLIVFCLLVSTVWAKEEKNKRIQYCTTLEAVSYTHLTLPTICSV